METSGLGVSVLGGGWSVTLINRMVPLHSSPILWRLCLDPPVLGGVTSKELPSVAFVAGFLHLLGVSEVCGSLRLSPPVDGSITLRRVDRPPRRPLFLDTWARPPLRRL